MIVCPDKVNQMRHLEFLKDKAGVLEHMKKHAEIVRPKFEVAFDALDVLSAEIGTYQKPTGGYFISYRRQETYRQKSHRALQRSGSADNSGRLNLPPFS